MPSDPPTTDLTFPILIPLLIIMITPCDQDSLHMFSIPHHSFAFSQQEIRSIRQLAAVSRAHLSGMCKHSLMLLRNPGIPCRHRGWRTLARMIGTQKQRVLLESWRMWGVLGSVRTYEEVEESLIESQQLCWEIHHSIVLCRSGLQATHSVAHHCLGHSSQLLTFHFMYSHFPRERIQFGQHPTQKTLWDRVFGQATSKEPDLWLGHQSTGQSCATRGAELTAQVVATVKYLPMTSVWWSLEHHRSHCPAPQWEMQWDGGYPL